MMSSVSFEGLAEHWPALESHLELTSLVMPARGLNELVLMEAVSLPVQMRTSHLAGMLSAGPKYTARFLKVVNSPTTDIVFFADTDGKVSIPRWQLDGCGVLILIRDVYDQAFALEHLEVAWDMEIPVVQLDCTTGARVRLTRKEGPDES
jgi:hypothetical protein